MVLINSNKILGRREEKHETPSYGHCNSCQCQTMVWVANEETQIAFLEFF